MFENYKKFKTSIAGRKFSIETGKFAGLANGSCFVRYGETVVNVAVAASNKPREGIDFFPLSVDFEERLYSVGKIPGSYIKREGRPSEKAILSSRAIDRPIRPLFPKDLRNDVAVTCTIMSVDYDCSPEIASLIGTSCALSISDIPWNGPISGVSVGRIDQKFLINPTAEEKKESDMLVTVVSNEDLIVMIEASGNEIEDDVMYDAIMFGHKYNEKIIKFIENIKNEVGKNKFSYESTRIEKQMFEKIKEFCHDEIKKVYGDKKTYNDFISKIKEKTIKHFILEYEDEKKIEECLYKVQKEVVRDLLINENKRVDGRTINEIRPLSSEVSLLPRVHGSGLFNRGQTQILTTVTLGSISDEQSLDGIDEEESKRYIHHYNFPSYSVGETRPNRGPGRREIGHGALAEKALIPVLPNKEDFPYAIRLVSEVLSSNGSTSQGAVCGSTLALMDAGVPIKSPVAGISCGLVKEGEKFITMVDIQGIEDFFGDMDFKVAGTNKGITAIQMDLKINGLTKEIIKEALEKTKKARIYILDEVILKTIKKPRSELSKYAPKMLSTTIFSEKIGDIIGSGGKIVQKISLDFDVKIDIEENGTIFVSSNDIENCKKAIETINLIANGPKVGNIYKVRVSSLTKFGVFVEIAPGKEALCHISQLDKERVEKASDVVSIDDEIFVKVVDIDNKGRISVSRKDVLSKVEINHKE